MSVEQLFFTWDVFQTKAIQKNYYFSFFVRDCTAICLKGVIFISFPMAFEISHRES